MDLLIAVAVICGWIGLGLWTGYAIYLSRAALTLFVVVLVSAIPLLGAPSVRFDGDKFNFGPVILQVISGSLLLGAILGLGLGALREAKARRAGRPLPKRGASLPAILVIVFMIWMSLEFIEKYFFST